MPWISGNSVTWHHVPHLDDESSNARTTLCGRDILAVFQSRTIPSYGGSMAAAGAVRCTECYRRLLRKERS